MQPPDRRAAAGHALQTLLSLRGAEGNVPLRQLRHLKADHAGDDRQIVSDAVVGLLELHEVKSFGYGQG